MSDKLPRISRILDGHERTVKDDHYYEPHTKSWILVKRLAGKLALEFDVVKRRIR